MAKSKNPFIPKETNMLTWAVGVVVAVTTIGGAAWTLGKPPYENRDRADERYAEVQAQRYEDRADQLEQRLLDLRYKEKTAPPAVRGLIREDIEKTQKQLEKTQKKIEQLDKKK